MATLVNTLVTVLLNGPQKSLNLPAFTEAFKNASKGQYSSITPLLITWISTKMKSKVWASAATIIISLEILHGFLSRNVQ